ncbi:MAG: hypothetical protein WCT77_09690 [Bacteroidota bacterium]|jgi:hypothetical protein
MKNKHIILLLLTSVLMLKACGPDPRFFKTTKFELSKKDKLNLLDSIKIIDVVDNRIRKDSVIGYISSGKEPYIIRQPLTKYLKKSFTTLLVKDTSQTTYTPVTISVEEFKSGFDDLLLGTSFFHKYSYLFSFPIQSGKTEKVRIFDSIWSSTPDCGIPLIDLTKGGIKEASGLFSFYFNLCKSNIKDSIFRFDTLYRIVKPGNSLEDIDTINMNNYRKLLNKSKSGSLFNLYRGNKGGGITIGGIILEHPDSSRFEGEFDAGFSYFSINNVNGSHSASDGIGAVNVSLHIRYNLFKTSQILFLSGGLGLNAGIQTVGYHLKKIKLFIGPNVEESIGLCLFEQITFKFGCYQLLFLGSDKMPYDLGVVFSLSFTGVY